MPLSERDPPATWHEELVPPALLLASNIVLIIHCHDGQSAGPQTKGDEHGSRERREAAGNTVHESRATGRVALDPSGGELRPR